MKITNYSSYDNYTVKSYTKNITNIIDKMIRLTAKLTELYASDIVYEINDLEQAVANHKEYDSILFFREAGVSSREVENIPDKLLESLNHSLQTWWLTHSPETMETTLIRVCLREGN